jgi:CheY-like chemotaxis protein
MMNNGEFKPVEVLLVEDSPSDTELAIEALLFAKMRNHLHTVEDGVQAMQFLRREGPYADVPRPDLILLDLNLPRKDGHEVLAELRADKDLTTIPVAVLTASTSERDFLRASRLSADYFLTKPVDFVEFLEVVRSIESFGVMVVIVPSANIPSPIPRTV